MAFYLLVLSGEQSQFFDLFLSGIAKPVGALISYVFLPP